VVYTYFPRWYVDSEVLDLYSLTEDACLQVPPFDQRILAQRAAFLIFADPAKELTSSEFGPELKRMKCGDVDLLKFLVPPEAKLIIHRQLEDVGMTRRALFPDLDGLSRDFVAEALYLEAFDAARQKP
jgi:hypothetical protein